MESPSNETSIQDENLVRAVISGDTKQLSRLLTLNPDLNKKDQDGFTLLFWAGNEGHLEVMRLLLEHGADPNGNSEEGFFPLRNAAAEGELPQLELLLEPVMHFSRVQQL